jgi:hypothetical protein
MKHSLLPTITLLVSLLFALACSGLWEPTEYKYDGELSTISSPISTPIEPVALSEHDLIVLQGSTSGAQIIQYSDWRCPHCLTAYPIVHAAAKKASATLRFRNYPLSAGCNALIEGRSNELRCALAFASICAHRAGTFDAFVKDATQFDENLLDRWTTDPEFSACMGDQTVKDQVRAQTITAQDLGILGTPTFYVRVDGVWRKTRMPKEVIAILEY